MRRRTQALLQVAVAFMQAPDDRHWGYELSKKASLRSGVLYPMLQRMLDDEWLTDGWENPAEIKGRPPRRYYELTDLGRRELGALAAAATAEHVKHAPKGKFA
jgi:PadR family transcriptional regulator, regulatory protein PadR